MSNREALVSCQNICKVYKKGKQEIKPLHELDLDIYQGEFLAHMGPSGSGKTTLLNLLAGIDSPSSGRLTFNGMDITNFSRRKLTKFRAENIGYIFQLYHLVPVLTAYENVELPLLIQPMSGKERHQRVSKALELANIADRASHYPNQLSGGQEQRVAIARALVNRPKCVLMDEPTGNLDEGTAQTIQELMVTLQHELKTSFVIVTHDRQLAYKMDHVMLMEQGNLTILDKTDALSTS